MSPRREAPEWRTALEAHTTWQHWTAGLPVQWHSDGVTLRDIPARWGREMTVAAVHRDGAALAPPRLRIWGLIRLILRRGYRVVLVPTRDKQALHMRITEKGR